MRTILFFDPIQAGKGGADQDGLELAVEKGGMGSYSMFEQFTKDNNLNVIATIYCGPEYYKTHKEDVDSKIMKLLSKLKAEVVICGPCYNFPEYTEMACSFAKFLTDNNDITSIVLCATSKNEQTIETYKDSITIIEMPKKGATGLRTSLKNMTKIAELLRNNEPLGIYEQYILK